MQRFIFCIVVLGLMACSSGGAEDCQKNLALCMEECTVQTGHCSPTDGGSGDASYGDASLLSLRVSPGTLSPAFSPNTTLYTVMVGTLVSSVQITATASDSAATLELNGSKLASGAPSAPITLGPMMATILLTVHGRGEAVRSYTLVVMRAQGGISYLKSSNSERGDQFGAAGEDSAATGVGGDQADNSALNSGAVYVFQRTGTSWAQQAYVKASNSNAFDLFGTSVSLSGDTLAVGAVVEDSQATGVGGAQADNSVLDSGAVYVFRRTGTSWAQQAYVKATNTDANDNFGSDVAFSGGTLAVAAYREASQATGVGGDQADNSASNSGAVYCF